MQRIPYQPWDYTPPAPPTAPPLVWQSVTQEEERRTIEAHGRFLHYFPVLAAKEVLFRSFRCSIVSGKIADQGEAFITNSSLTFVGSYLALIWIPLNIFCSIRPGTISQMPVNQREAPIVHLIPDNQLSLARVDGIQLFTTNGNVHVFFGFEGCFPHTFQSVLDHAWRSLQTINNNNINNTIKTKNDLSWPGESSIAWPSDKQQPSVQQQKSIYSDIELRKSQKEVIAWPEEKKKVQEQNQQRQASKANKQQSHRSGKSSSATNTPVSPRNTKSSSSATNTPTSPRNVKPTSSSSSTLTSTPSSSSSSNSSSSSSSSVSKNSSSRFKKVKELLLPTKRDPNDLKFSKNVALVRKDCQDVMFLFPKVEVQYGMSVDESFFKLTDSALKEDIALGMSKFIKYGFLNKPDGLLWYFNRTQEGEEEFCKAVSYIYLRVSAADREALDIDYISKTKTLIFGIYPKAYQYEEFIGFGRSVDERVFNSMFVPSETVAKTSPREVAAPPKLNKSSKLTESTPVISQNGPKVGSNRSSFSDGNSPSITKTKTSPNIIKVAARSRPTPPPRYSNEGRSALMKSSPANLEPESIKPVEEWSVDEIKVWVRDVVGLGEEEASKFENNRIDGATLVELHEEELKQDIGITVLGDRKRIMRSLGSLRPGGNKNGNVEDEEEFIPGSSLKFQKVLGSGFFGEVWLAKWNNKVNVAVKYLTNGGSVEEFMSEVRILRKVKHPHVLISYGLSRDDKRGLMLVTEFMDGGSLLDFLREKNEIGPKVLLQICIDICSGMDHLERIGIVHRDLAARNVLVSTKNDDDVMVKLSDFGLGKMLDEKSYYVSSEAKPMPIKWTAPEALTQRRFSSSSDSWSFAVTCWEIWSGGTEPYCDWDGKLLKNLKNGDRLTCPSRFPAGGYWEECIAPCFAWEPKDRPSFEVLYTRLECVLNELFGVDDEEESDSVDFQRMQNDYNLPDDGTYSQANRINDNNSDYKDDLNNNNNYNKEGVQYDSNPSLGM